MEQSLKESIDKFRNKLNLLFEADQPDNQEWGPIGRIFTLNKEEILDAYHLFIDTGMFDNFKTLL